MGDKAGEAIARSGAGAKMGGLSGCGRFGEATPAESCAEKTAGPDISTFNEPSTPCSKIPLFVSVDPIVGPAELPPETPGLSSYSTGENLTATLAFLCPGNCAMGGRAKLARE